MGCVRVSRGRPHSDQRRGRDSNPRTRFPPLRDFQSRPFNRSGTSPALEHRLRRRSPDPRSSRRACEGYTTAPSSVARLPAMLLAASQAFSKTFGLIVTFGGIGVIVNVIVVII